jgi:signal recognition particle GTPase
MFDELSQRFEAAVKNLKGQASISESNVDGALKEVRRALLEADVSLPVVKDFVDDVRRKAIGAEVVRGISPDQKFIQVVHEQLVETMGGDNAPLAPAGKPGQPTVVLMAGLQGAGKTTATAKLGLHLKENGRRPLMVAADVYRPAAIDQLQTLGRQIGVEVFSLGDGASPEQIAAAGVQKGRDGGFDTVLVDTAGRLQIDQSMMEEMVRIREAVQPDEVLLVVDSMIGQEAAELTRAFHAQVGTLEPAALAALEAVSNSIIVEARKKFHQGNFEEALHGFQYCLAVAEKTTGSGDSSKIAEYGAMLHNIASCLHCLGDFATAKTYYERALQAFEGPPPSRFSYMLYGDVDRKRCDFVRERLIDIEHGRKPDLDKYLDGYGNRRDVTAELARERAEPTAYHPDERGIYVGGSYIPRQ